MKKSEKKKAEAELKEQETVETPAGDTPAPEEKPAEDPILKELEEAKAKRDEYLDMAQRSRAEFENYRRRNQNVRTDALAEGAANTIEALLPVLDNLERAVAAGGEGSFFDGVSMVLRQFNDSLKNLGVTEMECKPGDLFDANLHNAVLKGPADEEHPEGTLLQVFQKGYKYKDKVLRYAMVQVAE